jgi:hypothetical protein
MWGCGGSLKTALQNNTFKNNFTSVSLRVVLDGALAGKKTLLYGLGPNPVAGENCLIFSIFDHFSKLSEL